MSSVCRERFRSILPLLAVVALLLTAALVGGVVIAMSEKETE